VGGKREAEEKDPCLNFILFFFLSLFYFFFEKKNELWGPQMHPMSSVLVCGFIYFAFIAYFEWMHCDKYLHDVLFIIFGFVWLTLLYQAGFNIISLSDQIF
jgi:uncharacterized membrane protein